MVHERQRSADGYELNFATNTLGAFALTLALEPALLCAARAAAEGRAAAATAGGGGEAAAANPAAAGSRGAADGAPVGARVIFVSSGGMLTEPLVVEDMQVQRPGEGCQTACPCCS